MPNASVYTGDVAKAFASRIAVGFSFPLALTLVLLLYPLAVASAFTPLGPLARDLRLLLVAATF